MVETITVPRKTSCASTLSVSRVAWYLVEASGMAPIIITVSLSSSAADCR